MKLYEETMPDGRIRYRVRLIEDGHIDDSTYWSKREAHALHGKLAAKLQRHASLTVGDAFDAWYQEKLELGKARKTGCDNEKPRSAASSHRHDLRITQGFFRWCVRKGYWELIEKLGTVGRCCPAPA